jgi:hypothetical protein
MLWSKLLYFLQVCYLIFHTVRNYSLLLYSTLLFTWVCFYFSHHKKLLSYVIFDLFGHLNEHCTKIIKNWDLRLRSQLLYLLHGFDLIFHTIRNYFLLLYLISLIGYLNEHFTKIIKMWDIRLRSQLFYFLHGFNLIIYVVVDYPIPLDHIYLDILIEHFTKIIMTSDLRLWSELFFFLHGLYLVIHTVQITLFC